MLIRSPAWASYEDRKPIRALYSMPYVRYTAQYSPTLPVFVGCSAYRGNVHHCGMDLPLQRLERGEIETQDRSGRLGVRAGDDQRRMPDRPEYVRDSLALAARTGRRRPPCWCGSRSNGRHKTRARVRVRVHAPPCPRLASCPRPASTRAACPPTMPPSVASE